MGNPENVENLQRAQLIAHKEILSFKEALIYLEAIEFTKPNGGKIYFKKSDLDNWMLQSKPESERVLEDEIFNHLKRNGNGKKIN
mgnify:CR=1 FL=1